MADSATRVPVQQPAVAVPAVSAKLASYYRYRAGVGALLLVNLGIGGLFSLALILHILLRIFNFSFIDCIRALVF